MGIVFVDLLCDVLSTSNGAARETSASVYIAAIRQ